MAAALSVESWLTGRACEERDAEGHEGEREQEVARGEREVAAIDVGELLVSTGARCIGCARTTSHMHRSRSKIDVDG